MSACWINPAGPPMAVTRAAVTLVGVTFTFGFAHCGWLKTLVVVSSIRNVGALGAVRKPESLVQPEVAEVEARTFH